jgi:molybdopterin-guanine dinucleotide biosynthesis protein A
MDNQKEVAGVILAGGLARRMENQDKGLLSYNGRPLVSYAINALSGVTDQVVINANRNLEVYQTFGLPVVIDQQADFQGPLAGILSAMIFTTANELVVVPCDSPLIKAEHLHKLLTMRAEANADVAVAFDGERLHPVFLAIKTSLRSSLQTYLDDGHRKVEKWLNQHRVVTVDFSDQPQVFRNINTLTDLEALEALDKRNDFTVS